VTGVQTCALPISARVIVEQTYLALRPGGHAMWVVKSFVRNKQIVDFTGQWRQLCETCGFQTLHEHHAMLVAEAEQPDLFGGKPKRRERKSFFRRLAESKGSPRIDYEVVLCQVKPDTEGGFADCCVSSPPYAESLQPETEEQTRHKQERIARSKTIYDGRDLEMPSPGKAALGGGYGTTPGNLGNMKVKPT